MDRGSVDFLEYLKCVFCQLRRLVDHLKTAHIEALLEMFGIPEGTFVPESS